MLAGDDAEHGEISVFAEALFFEAFAQLQLGAVHDDPVVGRREAEFLTNFFGRYFLHEAQGEHGPVPGRQPLLAAAQGVVQLLLLGGGVGGAPARGGLRAGPVAVFGNEEIGFGGAAVAQLVEADAGRAGLAAVVVDDFAPQDDKQPRAFRGLAPERSQPFEGAQKSVLHQLFRGVVVAHAAQGEAVQLVGVAVGPLGGNGRRWVYAGQQVAALNSAKA